MRVALQIPLILLSLTTLQATERVVKGNVTYIASGTVYTSLGKQSGVTDSSSVYILAKADTLAVLKVFAVSSSSSACVVLSAKRPPRVGDEVVALVAESRQVVTVPQDSANEQSPLKTRAGSDLQSMKFSDESKGIMEVRGRLSAQYYGTTYSTSNFSTSQPGLVLNVQANATDIPLRFELYTNVRTLSYGSDGGVSRNGINLSRVYRLTLSYDDGTSTVAVGRLIPNAIPSIGYIDGVVASVKLGQIELGSLLGYQPGLALRTVSSDFKKVGAFARFTADAPLNLSVSSAYARTYFHNTLDREMISAQVSAFTAYNLYVYANSEVDLRKKSGSDLVLSPVLTSMFVNVSYRFSRALTIGVGGEASRPVLPFSSVRNIPDSLLDYRLKSGVSLNVGIFLPGGVSISDTYSPRNADGGFGKEYANIASVGLSDILSSGITVRSNITNTSNAFTNSTGYGAHAQRNIIGIFDVSVRYQRYGYKIRGSNRSDHSTTVGADLLVSLTRQLALMTSYDNLSGFGSRSHSIFTELTLRF